MYFYQAYLSTSKNRTLHLVLTSEQEIIEGCRQGLKHSQEQLYRQYYSLFLKVCARYARDMMDAEQLLNDGFMKIFSQIHQYKNEGGSFEGWMRRIMINTCLDYLRSKYLKNAQQTRTGHDEAMIGTADTDTNGLSNLAFKDLLRMIQTLPVMTRTVFNLYVFESFTHKQIAEQLSISTGTSHWHLNQARGTLQQKIALVNTVKKPVS